MDPNYLDDVNLDPTFPQPPRAPWWRLGRASLSDDEYIERLRKTVARAECWKRWRWIAVILFLSMIGVCLWLAFKFDAMLADFDQIAPHFANQNRGAIVLLGLLLGIKFGSMFQGAVFSLIWILTFDDRTERLLLKYVDRQSPAECSVDSLSPCDLHGSQYVEYGGNSSTLNPTLTTPSDPRTIR